MIIIGSYAVFQWLPYNREIKDIDLLCTREEFSEIIKHTYDNHQVEKLQIKESGAMIKAEGCLPLEVQFYGEGQFKFSNVMIENTMYSASNRKIPYYKNSIKCIDIDFYYVMKETHKYRKNSQHFMKTMQDIYSLKSIKNIENIDKLKVKFKEFYDTRCEETYDYNHPNLNQNKQEFFTDSVGYIYDHDDTHEAVKHLDKPAYQYYIEDRCEVKCSKEKFDKLPEIIKLYGVLEEAYVLAIERAVVPNGVDPDRAFDIALEKVCTSITSGWFREFAYNNYFEVRKLYHHSYWNKFLNALNNNKIKPFRSK